jgi:ATP-dependent Clp protease ATP-binding subunit ClpA
VERYVENPLSFMILRGEAKEGDTIGADVADNELTFDTVTS